MPCRAGMPPITRRLRGYRLRFFFRKFVFTVGSSCFQNRAVIRRPVLPDQSLLLLPFQEFRLPAVIRAGSISVLAPFAGIVAIVTDGCVHRIAPKMVARGRSRTGLLRRGKKVRKASAREAPPRRITSGTWLKPEGGLCLLSAGNW